MKFLFYISFISIIVYNNIFSLFLVKCDAVIFDDILSLILNNVTIDFKVEALFTIFSQLNVSVTFNNLYDNPFMIFNQAIEICDNISANYNKTMKKEEYNLFLLATLQTQFFKKYQIIKIITTNYLSKCNNVTNHFVLQNIENNQNTMLLLPVEVIIINSQDCVKLNNYYEDVIVNTADYKEIMDLINYDSYILDILSNSFNNSNSLGSSIHNINNRLEQYKPILEYIKLRLLDFIPSASPKIQLKNDSEDRLLAIVTIVRNEAVFLPIWLKYYTSLVEPQHIYIIDNDSTDGSTTDIPYHVIKAPSEYYCSHKWILETVQTVVDSLLTIGYDYVLFAEVDEFIIPSPTLYPGGLQEYIKNMKQPTVRATGYNLFHDYVNNPQPIDLSKSILSQRNVWYPDVLYSKNAITSISLWWIAGFHGVDFPKEYENMIPDPNLYLLHIKKFDYQYYINRGHWKAIQSFDMFEYFNIFLSITAHTVGSNLINSYWSTTGEWYTLIRQTMQNSTSNNRILENFKQVMYSKLENIPSEFSILYDIL